MTGFILYFITLIFLIISGINPVDTFTWWLEISWVILGLILCAMLYIKKIEITIILKYALFAHAVILIYGGWYTYELVPLGELMKEIFGFTRNNYDRIGHFAQGFFPVILYRELLFRYKPVKPGLCMEWFIFTGCFAFSAFFELLEFGSAKLFGSASDAFLGMQGDIWDAQWDMLMCGIGCLASILLLRQLHIKFLKKLY